MKIKQKRLQRTSVKLQKTNYANSACWKNGENIQNTNTHESEFGSHF